ncbi:Flp pilus assembly protein CpaB [Hyphomonas sp. FCG-A18]|uniref:Flp pilus assembly protein CpaB n=1 Tax=Hyphomonas sp. FCG-A18 TaxID=3080019 RepID=UPI002B28C291|nr:Flp pilus assembly protein CpaB [Hyphomonas sp. FCG-A18]
MSPMRLIILAVAAIAAVAAAFLVRGMANAPAPTTTAEPTTIVKEVEVSQIKVLVAANDLPIGTLIGPSDFAWADWPEKTLNPGFFTEAVQPDAMETLAGSVVRSTIYADEPILPQKIVQKGETGFMAALLGPGKRAVSLEISPESASAGFILPDDRVDVIVTYDVEVLQGETMVDRTVVVTAMENARVLAIDQMFGEVDGVPALTGSTATLELTPEQAELMSIASRKGTISLTLRSHADAGDNNGEATARLDLIDDDVGTGDQVLIFRNGNVSTGG